MSWINLQKVTLLALEQSSDSFKILSQILRGFGVREIHGCLDVQEARELAGRIHFDLMIADPSADNGKGLEFLAWLRRSDLDPNRFAPLILVSGHSTKTSVVLSRDAGASFYVAKPLSPKMLLDRILFVARERRAFIEASDYVGPDRRFKTEALPEGVKGRRERDRLNEANAAPDPVLTKATL